MRRLLALILASAVGSFALAGESQHLLPDGTLLFLENCNSVVQWATHGKIAHVAIVLQEGNAAWVYEATPSKVRKVSLADYDRELSELNRRRDDDERIRLVALRPRPEYSAAELTKMRAFLHSQLGRRYSVKNYVRGKPYDGIHCAELAATTLNHSGRYDFRDCHTIHPQALYTAALSSHAEPQIVPISPPAEKEAWYVRFQRRCFGWTTWCRWSSREAWLFLW